MSVSGDGEKKPNGRPAASFSDGARCAAETLAREGKPDDDIAVALNVSVPTLRKHLGDTLATVRAEKSPLMFDGTAPSPAAIQPEPVALPAKRRGRPRYLPLSMDRDRVRMLAASGISVAVIAGRLNISVPTLLKAHEDDLKTAREMARAQIIENLHRQMSKGSTSAASKLAEMINEADLATLRANAPAAVKIEKPEKETLGKKVQAARSAQDEAQHGRWSKTERLARLQ